MMRVPSESVIVARCPRDVHEVGDFPVGPIFAGIDHQGDRHLRVPILQRPDIADGGVLRILDSEDEIDLARIVDLA